MDVVALLGARGRLGRRAFALWVTAIYLAGMAAQGLLSSDVTAGAGLWPFVGAQGALIWAWLVVHIRRLRDAGQGPAGAIGVALIYALALGLLLMLIVFLTNPNVVPPEAAESPADLGFKMALVIVLLGLLFSPDFGMFMTILKLLIFIACLPALVSLIFSIRTGLRRSVP